MLKTKWCDAVATHVTVGDGLINDIPHLEMPDTNASGSIPETFGDLIRLRVLNLGNNYLSGEV